MEGKFINVREFEGVRNQFIITTTKGRYFQSYETLIAFIPNDNEKKIQLDRKMWNCSVTTSKYRNRFLGENLKETRKKLAVGDYVYRNLNK